MQPTTAAIDTGQDAPRRSLSARIGIGAALLLRYLYALFFTSAAYSKWSNGIIWTDWTERTFEGRLVELEPGTIGYWFLENIGIPYHGVLSWIITFSWTAVALGLLLGFATRWAALLGAFICVMIGVGGFYDASLIPLIIIPLIIAALPTGQWLGLDRRMQRKYPESIWFR